MDGTDWPWADRLGTAELSGTKPQQRVVCKPVHERTGITRGLEGYINC